MPSHVRRDFVAELLNEVGQFRSRANNAHVSIQHIDKLRKFIQAHFSEELSERRDPAVARLRVLSVRRIIALDMHSPKLQHLESFPVQTDALLRKEYGT